MTVRTPESVVLEADYWQLLLTSLDGLNDDIAQAAGHLRDIPIALVTASVATWANPAATAELDRASAAVSATLARLRAMQEHVTTITRLAEGRATVLRDEAGLRV